MMRTTLSAGVVALLLVTGLFVTGCGSVTTERAGLQGASGPRIDGTWKVTFKPKNYRGEVTRVTWYVTPLCSSGACSFDFRSTGKLRGRFVFDRESRGYELKKRTLSPCVAGDSDKVLVRVAYREDRNIKFRVTGQRVEGERQLATELRGEDVANTAMTKEAVRAKCLPPGREVDKFTAVRVTPVSGATSPAN